MSRALRTWRLLAQAVLIVALSGGLILGAAANAIRPASLCVMAGGAPAAICHDCCAALPCCLGSKHGPAAPLAPVPLNSERGNHLDLAPIVATLMPNFDFFSASARMKNAGGRRVVPAVRGQATRGAVSCIWLI